MVVRWMVLWLCVFCCTAAVVQSADINSPDWPRISVAGSEEQHVEALGTRAGIWGTLSKGLEGWVYPFKAFDSLEFGLVDKDENFRSIHGSIYRQTATPHDVELVFRDDEWEFRITLFVPRDIPGGFISYEGTVPERLRPAVCFRGVLAPMHREIPSALVREWNAEAGAFSFYERSRDVSLVFTGSGGVFEPRLIDGRAVLLLSTGAKTGGNLGFALRTGGRERIHNWGASLLRSKETLRLDSRRYYRELMDGFPRIVTPDAEVNRALLWAGISLDQLRVVNPDLGSGLVSGYSSSNGTPRPKYACFFEEPTLTSWAYHRMGLSSRIKESLAFLARYQRQDGKTVHEVSQSLKHWPTYFEEFRYAYGHTDGPVYYLAAYGEYLRCTGDIEFIRAQWGFIRRTFEWCLGKVDSVDGLITIDHGDWGSAESSTDILKDTQLEAMWVRALRELAFLSRRVGDVALARQADALRDRARASIERDFWDEDRNYYIWGMNRAGEKVSSLVPHHAIGFWLSELRHDRVSRALKTLAGSEFMTDWGVRSLALSDPKFDEASYQSGSVWPVWNAGVMISDFQNGQAERGFWNWRNTIRARWRSGLGPMPEVFRGDRFELLPEAVPHQMFSEVAVVNGFFDGLLGLELDVTDRRVVLAPRLPAAWDRGDVGRIPFGEEVFDLFIRRNQGRYSIRIEGDFDAPVTFELEPEISTGGLVRSVSDSLGSPYFRVAPMAAASKILVERELNSRPYELEIEHDGMFGFWVRPSELVVGESSRDLRVIHYEVKGGWWRAIVEGRPSMAYQLEFRSRHGPVEIIGGNLIGGGQAGYVVETSSGPGLVENRAGYVRWPLAIRLQDRPERAELLKGLEEPSGEIAEATRSRWDKKVERIRTRMQAVMGRLPGEERRVPPNVIIEKEDDCGSYVRRLISYQSEPGSRVPAYLSIPKDCLSGTRKAHGVLCLHPTDDKVGHKVVVGLGGRAGRNYADELARRGLVTLAPSYPLLANYQPDLAALGYRSGTMKAIWDNQRAIDLLTSLPYVVPDAVGAIGPSLGGHNAIYTAVFDERIRVIVSSCGFDSYLDYIGGDIRGWTSTRYMPGLLDYELREIPFDFYELIGALAPRGVFVSAPQGDSNFRFRSVERIIRAARPVFELLGAESSLVVRYPDCGHDFPQETRDESYRFIAAHLGATLRERQ